jgi:hypothetical protein
VRDWPDHERALGRSSIREWVDRGPRRASSRADCRDPVEYRLAPGREGPGEFGSAGRSAADDRPEGFDRITCPYACERFAPGYGASRSPNCRMLGSDIEESEDGPPMRCRLGAWRPEGFAWPSNIGCGLYGDGIDSASWIRDRMRFDALIRSLPIPGFSRLDRAPGRPIAGYFDNR